MPHTDMYKQNYSKEHFDQFKNDFIISFGPRAKVESNLGMVGSVFGGDYNDIVLENYIGQAKTIKIPHGITRIGKFDPVFQNVTRGTTVKIPNTVHKISSRSFFGFQGNVHIPSSVNVIELGAFQRSSGFITFDNVETELYIGEHAFYRCTNIRELPESFGTKNVRIADCAFEGCTNLEILPDCLEEVGMGVFGGCTSIRNLPSKLKVVRANAFANCSGITSIPFSLEEIGANAFENCTSLTEINVGRGLTKIGENAFLGCPIEKINLSIAVNDLSHDLFHCTNLKHYLIKGIPIKKFIGGTSFVHAKEKWVNNIDLGNKKDSNVLKNVIFGIKNLKEYFWACFNIEIFKENLSLLREVGMNDDQIATCMINNKNSYGNNINDIIDNFNYIASQKIIPLDELKKLFFEDSTIVFEGKTKEEQKVDLINSLKKYYLEHNKLPDLFWRLAFKPTNQNRLELRDNMMYIAQREFFVDLDKTKKQTIITMLNKEEFENISSFDRENFKKETAINNLYFRYEGKYKDYFKGIQTSFYRKLSGISEDYFSEFMEMMKDANEKGVFNEFMKSLNTIRNWEKFEKKERAGLLKNEIIGRLLYASIEMSFPDPTTIPSDSISKRTLLKEKMKRLDFNKVLKKATEVDFKADYVNKLMLEIDPYSFDAFRFDSTLTAKYCVIARSNGYLFDEQELNIQKENIKNILDNFKELIKKYHIEESQGVSHTIDEVHQMRLIKDDNAIIGRNLKTLNGEFRYSDEHIFEYLNNSVGIPKLPSKENKDYLKQMEISLREYVNKETTSMNGFLRMLDFYMRANSEITMQYGKKYAIEVAAKKIFDVYEEKIGETPEETAKTLLDAKAGKKTKEKIEDHDRLLYSLYNLNKLAHSINEKHLRIDLIDKRLIDTEEEYRNLTTAIKAINELMDNGISLEETLSFIGIGENKTNELQRRVSNRSELGDATKLTQILKHGFSLIRNKYTDFRIVGHFKETVSIEEKDNIKYKNGEAISRNLKILLELKDQQVLNKTNLEKIRLLSSQRKLFFKTKQIIAEELMKKTIEEIGVSNFISMTEEQKYDFYRKNGYIVEVQRQPIRNENQEIIGYQPLLTCYSKTFNESFSVHMVGLSKEIEEKVNEYINSDKYHATISHTVLSSPGLTLKEKINLEKVKPEQLVKAPGFAVNGVANEYLPALYNYLKYDCHDALKSNPNPTEEDLRNLLEGKFTLPNKLDLKAYVRSLQQGKAQVQTNKSISVPEPIVKVLKKLHINFGSLPGIEDTQTKGK